MKRRKRRAWAKLNSIYKIRSTCTAERRWKRHLSIAVGWYDLRIERDKVHRPRRGRPLHCWARSFPSYARLPVAFQSALPSISVIRRSFGHYGYWEVTLSASFNRNSSNSFLRRFFTNEHDYKREFRIEKASTTWMPRFCPLCVEEGYVWTWCYAGGDFTLPIYIVLTRLTFYVQR